MNLSVLYRGPLASCNYRCRYCPFAKRVDSPAQLARDRAALTRFSDWLQRETEHRWRVFFTPWGEALVRAWYRQAMTALTHVEHIESVAVQTNLACRLDWIRDCRTDRLAFWATYHPTECKAERFVEKVCALRGWGVRISVGMVGAPELIDHVRFIRRQLPHDIYLWINAQQPRPRPYTSAEVAAFRAIDPRFEITLRRQKSWGRPCGAGETAFTVDGVGDIRRCHFVDEVIGNIEEPDWDSALRPRRCPRLFCDCFLGKAQIQADELTPFFGAASLERQPAGAGLFGLAVD
jgi:MoaA/NifB/PqqE/SkfB family radical SAM enzyme